jgi:hypothetical protein
MRVLLASVTTFLFLVGWSLGSALTAPGGGTFAERLAEWARNNNLGALVTFGEWLAYTPPPVGGRPHMSLNQPGINAKPPAKVHSGPQAIIPANLTSPAGRPLPGEGVWRVIGTVHGLPAMFRTFLREDAVHTSQVAGIVSMDPRLLRFSLRPGSIDQSTATNWGVPMDIIPPGTRRGLLATFNGGFRLVQDTSRGGFYLNGHYDYPLVKGAASEVYYRDGRMRIGAWGYGGLHLGPGVAGVRQNLRLIVSHGKLPPSVSQNVESNWGATVGGLYYVWRSGVGETADGRIVFVYGPTLDARTLAALLQRAGCVTAMELDINQDWTNFMYYVPGSNPGNPTPHVVLFTQKRPADRYYTYSDRDFTAVYAR